MKAFILISLLAAALTAQAGNEGAQAVPGRPAETMAAYISNGGFFVPPGAESSHHYEIRSDHSAVKVTYFRSDRAPVARILKILNQNEWTYFLDLVSQIQPGALYDPQPKRPMCQDGPSYSYTVKNSQGVIRISETFGCKTMARKNASAADEEIMKILKSLESL